MRVPLNHPCYFRIFHEINQPATVGVRNPSPPISDAWNPKKDGINHLSSGAGFRWPIHSMGDSPMTVEPPIESHWPINPKRPKKKPSHAPHQCLPASRDWRSKAHSPREFGWSGISWWFHRMFMFFMFTNVYNHPMKSGKNLVNISKHENMSAWAGKTIWLVV